MFRTIMAEAHSTCLLTQVKDLEESCKLDFNTAQVEGKGARGYMKMQKKRLKIWLGTRTHPWSEFLTCTLHCTVHDSLRSRATRAPVDCTRTPLRPKGDMDYVKPLLPVAVE
ncbi:uncharacterized protein LOC143020561 [Oratosquilla oratoria]|uniref:uncharacterized protein LOC143020561 n=1 Tax=Oratosquilla oratoria TaxID=337810 RepID=UPI003F77369A